MPYIVLSQAQTVASALLLGAALLSGCSEGFHSLGFLERIETPLGTNRNAVTLGLGDLDGDGRQDAVVTNTQNEVNVLISDGSGRFATGVAYAAPNIGGGAPRSLVVGDLSGDGRADVVVGNILQGNLSIYWNQGNGQLQADANNPLAVNCQPVALASYDMNGDGQSDIVVACANPNEIHVLKNRGGQKGFDSFTLKYTQNAGAGTPSAPRSLAVGELNGDTAPDIAIGTDSDMRILNSPREGMTNYVVSIPATVQAGALAVADMNGNGLQDLVLLANNQELRIFEHASAGTYNQIVDYQNVGEPGRNTTQGLGVGDFRQSGRPDMVVTLPTPNAVKLLVNQGETNIVTNPLFVGYEFGSEVSVSDNCIAVGDVTGDGLSDLVLRTGAMTGGSVSVLVNASQK